jgi:hypothetical protein
MATGGLGVHDPVSVERRRICGRSGTDDCGSGHQSDGAHTIADHGSLLSSLVASIWPLTNPSLYAFFQPIAVASAQQLIQIFQMPNSSGKRQPMPDIGRLGRYTIEMGGNIELLELALQVPGWGARGDAWNRGG